MVRALISRSTVESHAALVPVADGIPHSAKPGSGLGYYIISIPAAPAAMASDAKYRMTLLPEY